MSSGNFICSFIFILPYLVCEESADETVHQHDEDLSKSESFGGPDEFVLVILLLPFQVIVTTKPDDPVAQVVDVDPDHSEGLDQPQPSERRFALWEEEGRLGYCCVRINTKQNISKVD